MIETGIESIKKRINEQAVYAPSDMPMEKLDNWMSGYKTCMEAILKILDEFKDGR